MAIKTPYHNDTFPKLNFPWALKVTDFSELLFVSGHADVKQDNVTANFPNDLMAQTDFILAQLTKTIETAGFTVNDIVRREIILSKEVTDEQLPALFQRLGDFFNDVEVNPAGGTLRFVERLISRECLVEIEVMLAR